jgi:glycosyltransferase involved in cell wall biosynthesis
MNLYGVASDKIDVIYEGYENAENFTSRSFSENKIEKPYLLFVGRIEDRKNISNIIKAFEILKERYNIGHKLVLAGRVGYGYEKIRNQISNSRFSDDIIELGFVSEEEKWKLLKSAEVFIFPTLYEGFGIPILEAQSVGCPVVASNNSSIPEVVGESAILVKPESAMDIAENIFKLISDEKLKDDIIQKGLENVKRFSWEKCARQIAEILVKKN